MSSCCDTCGWVKDECVCISIKDSPGDADWILVDGRYLAVIVVARQKHDINVAHFGRNGGPEPTAAEMRKIGAACYDWANEMEPNAQVFDNLVRTDRGSTPGTDVRQELERMGRYIDDAEAMRCWTS